MHIFSQGDGQCTRHLASSFYSVFGIVNIYYSTARREIPHEHRRLFNTSRIGGYSRHRQPHPRKDTAARVCAGAGFELRAARLCAAVCARGRGWAASVWVCSIYAPLMSQTPCSRQSHVGRRVSWVCWAWRSCGLRQSSMSGLRRF